MTLPMLRILPPPWDFRMMTPSQASSGRDVSDAFCMDKYESIRKLAMIPQPPRNPNKPFTSFRINDILSPETENLSTQKTKKYTHKQSNHQRQHTSNGQHKHSAARSSDSLRHLRTQNAKHSYLQKAADSKPPNRVPPPPTASRIVRPWDASPSPGKYSEASSDADDEEINVDDDDDDDATTPSPLVSLKDVSPLDALMEMANKTFQGLETSEAADAKRREQAALFGKHATPKKRRKSRTAFTNQQIYELEKRFLYQKYLTPADRDEIAQNLNLTNAQVITWFQNRRAKLKRDLEELKNDVVATKQLSVKSGSSDHEFSIESDNDSPSIPCRPLHMSPKRSRSESKSPEPETNRPHSVAQSHEDSVDEQCESAEEIVVDDRDEAEKDQGS